MGPERFLGARDRYPWIWTSTPDAEEPAGFAWSVDLGAGFSSRLRQDFHSHALAVFAGEGQGAVTFTALRGACLNARRGKKPSRDQLAFEATWLDQQFSLQDALNSGTWHPGAPTCSIVDDPKHRQIHAPPFPDRVVHHWLIPQLEAIYEPIFIYDAYSNRKRKGTHEAGADPTEADRQGRLPVDVAYTHGQGADVSHLKSIGPPIARIGADASGREGRRSAA